MKIIKQIQKILKSIKNRLYLYRAIHLLRNQGKVMCTLYHINADRNRCGLCSAFKGEFGRCSNIKSWYGKSKKQKRC